MLPVVTIMEKVSVPLFFSYFFALLSQLSSSITLVVKTYPTMIESVYNMNE